LRRGARLAGGMSLLAVCLCVLGVVAMQFTGIVAKNVAVAQEVATSRADIRALRERERRQLQVIRRLSDPEGAIPEIHERLRLVGPHEEIIYVPGLPAPTAPPDDWAVAGEDGR
jgi:cell division protein FtsB